MISIDSTDYKTPEATGSEYTPPTRTIFVKTTIGRSTLTLSGIRNYSTVGDLKKMIGSQTGLPVDKQLLMFAGHFLDDSTILFDYQDSNV